MDNHTASSQASVDSGEQSPSILALAHREAALAHRAHAEELALCAKSLREQFKQAEATATRIKELETRALLAASGEREAARASSLAALEAALPSREFAKAVKFQTVDLAAMGKFGAKRSAWRIGDRLDLVAEPANKADKNAIKVLKDGKQVGYVSADDAAKLKGTAAKEGWSPAGPAFLAAASGGKWNDGRIQIRLENPIAGWSGFNPCDSFEANLAAMEKALLGSETAPTARAAKPRSL